jgi:hypothetical protein
MHANLVEVSVSSQLFCKCQLSPRPAILSPSPCFKELGGQVPKSVSELLKISILGLLIWLPSSIHSYVYVYVCVCVCVCSWLSYPNVRMVDQMKKWFLNNYRDEKTIMTLPLMASWNLETSNCSENRKCSIKFPKIEQTPNENSWWKFL